MQSCSFKKTLAVLALAAGLSAAGGAEAAWKTCNGVPVRPENIPLGFRRQWLQHWRQRHPTWT